MNEPRINERTLIQIVRGEWSKAARGGTLATRRNRVPLALRFDASGFDERESVWIEQHDAREPGFVLSRRVRHVSKSGDFSISGLLVRHLSEHTNVSGQLRCGAPERHASAHTDLQLGQSVRLRWNGRFGSLESYWSYVQITLNIARVAGDFAPDIFTSRAPDFHFEALAMLR